MIPIQVPNDGGKKVTILGIPMVIRIHGRNTGGVEIGKKFGLEILPPSGA